MPITLVIHGGAGNITPSMMNKQQEANYHEGLSRALNAGYSVLEKGGTAIDAVATAVVELENNPIFNAGKGSVFTKKGLHEMDAAMMEVHLQQALLRVLGT
jgi:beta-aspartyl-peptidase (threonine type)